MECLLQYLDDLDDLVHMLAFAAERIFTFFKALAMLALALGLQGCAVTLALVQPPLALAAASLLCVGLLYRAVINHGNPAVAAN